VKLQVLDLDPAGYKPHPLHTGERSWIETNCYADFWIEALHSLGCDPVAGLAFTLSTDFEGDQWTMFKYPSEDLRALFGLEVHELNVWLPLVDHVEEHLSLGRPLTIDTDAWFLPDTVGVTYAAAHQKTTVMVQMLDRDRRRLGYFHNAGYFELDGADFDGVLCVGADAASLPPYTEIVRLDQLHRGDDRLVERAVELTRAHLARRPPTNPIDRLCERLEADLPWLATHEMEAFHRYAFGTCRQCGANAELAADFSDWLGDHDGGGLDDVAECWRQIAAGAKALEFRLARAVAGRSVDIHGQLASMARAWDSAMEGLYARYGR
jgi:hypothetical protein